MGMIDNIMNQTARADGCMSRVAVADRGHMHNARIMAIGDVPHRRGDRGQGIQSQPPGFIIRHHMGLCGMRGGNKQEHSGSECAERGFPE